MNPNNSSFNNPQSFKPDVPYPYSPQTSVNTQPQTIDNSISMNMGLQNHIQYLNQLLQSGHPQHHLEAQWQQYYANLSPQDKKDIWQFLQNQSPQPEAQDQPTSYQNIDITPQLPLVTMGFKKEKTKNMDFDSFEPDLNDEDEEDFFIAQPLKTTLSPVLASHGVNMPPTTTIQQPTIQKPPPVNPQILTNNLPRQPSSFINTNNNNPSQPLNQMPPQSASQHSIPHHVPPPHNIQPTIASNNSRPNLPTELPPPKTKQITKIAPDTNVKNKVRKIANWNSKTALFNKEEKKQIKHQNLKSIVFGVVVGLIGLGVIAFAFLNERFVQPFVQPASLQTDTKVLISPGAAEETVEEGFRVVIPEISVIAPVVDSGSPFQKDDPNETSVQFEARMQKALEKGTIIYPTSQKPGETGINGKNSNVVILGHSGANFFVPGNYKNVFSRLNTLNKGDLIVIHYETKRYIYKIYEREVVPETATRILGPAKRNNSLTLITCDPPGTSDNRLVLYAEQISPDVENNTPIPIEVEDEDVIVPGKAKTLTDQIF